MKSRKFNSIMPVVNEKWVASVLNMERNPHNGADLVDEKKLLEVKFKLIFPEYPQSWTVQEHQLDYNNGKPCYWGLGTYLLDRPVSKIRTINHEKLEEMVKERTLYIVSWDWMNQYSPHETRGRTEITEWEYTFRYPKLKDLPTTASTHKVKKGLILLTDGVPEEDFKISATSY